jgi:hypothetical protein
VYDPNEANKSYMTLLKENGVSASFKSVLVVITTVIFNKLALQQETPISNIVLIYFLFCIYFSWRPKLVRFLRGHLRGNEYRNKAD